MKREGILFLSAMTLGLIFLSRNHFDNSLSEPLFRLFGLSPWSANDQSGFYWPSMIGLSLLIAGIAGMTKLYRPRFPKIRSRLIIACIVIIYFSPTISEQAMFLLKHNARGVHSMDYSKDDSRCRIDTNELSVQANCSFTIYNYGMEDEVVIKPIIVDRYEDHIDIDLEPQSVHLSPHSKVIFSVNLKGKQENNTGFSGTMRKLAVEIQIDGAKKIFD